MIVPRNIQHLFAARVEFGPFHDSGGECLGYLVVHYRSFLRGWRPRKNPNENFLHHFVGVNGLKSQLCEGAIVRKLCDAAANNAVGHDGGLQHVGLVITHGESVLPRVAPAEGGQNIHDTLRLWQGERGAIAFVGKRGEFPSTVREAKV